MKRIVVRLSVVLSLVLLFLGSCREDFEFRSSSGNLSFSRDTVFLDTVFTTIGSSTYTLKVYNSSNEDIFIPEVRLASGMESNYRLNVDGAAGKIFENIPLLARDSLFVFIETTFDISIVDENEFLYTDTLLFGDPLNRQGVELVTLVRDAIFLFPRTQQDGSRETVALGQDEAGNTIRIVGFEVSDENLNFTSEKPYVIYGYAVVGEEKTLRMDPGTRVHFHNDAGIFVRPGGRLEINGRGSTDEEALENEVIFEGDRLEPRFSDVPGQWGSVWLAGGTNHQIQNLTIRNATVGLLIDGNTPLQEVTARLRNTQIYNSSITNLWARTAQLEVSNSVFGSAGSASVFCQAGGNYDFKHCTIANYWTNGLRNTAALVLDNAISSSSEDLSVNTDLINAQFSNSILDGNRNLELALLDNGQNMFNYQFRNCAITFLDTQGLFSEDPLYNFDNPMFFQNAFLNPDVGFVAPLQQNYRLTATSTLIDLGDQDTASLIPLDILGIDRTPNPDLGAYEYREEE
ncbi:MAG: hypothetical protein AAF717_03055 [Bacteroidota bacterium]